MTSNELKLNDKKTEMLAIAPKNKHHLVEGITFRVGNEHHLTDVKNLRSRLDCHLNMNAEVSTAVRAGYLHMRSINRIRPL